MHRLTHFFMQMILAWRPHNFSIYGPESTDSVVSDGAKGNTKKPLKAILRLHEKLLHIENCRSFLRESQFFAQNFPQTRKLLFTKLYRQENRNWRKMIKVYYSNSVEARFYLEVMQETPNSEQTSNALISYSHNGHTYGGIIREIRRDC